VHKFALFAPAPFYHHFREMGLVTWEVQAPAEGDQDQVKYLRIELMLNWRPHFSEIIKNEWIELVSYV
jgi:hypothetical protein